jgi:hypothetical protein
MVPSASSRLAPIALALCFTIGFSSGCALLVPPSWRSDFDIGLFGPIDGKPRAPQPESTAPLDPDQRRLHMEQLAADIERDRQELVDLVVDPEASERSPADDPVLRRIVQQLPERQNELQALERTLADDAESTPVRR